MSANGPKRTCNAVPCHVSFCENSRRPDDGAAISSEPILETLDSFFLCAVVTAEKLAISFQSMTDNAASARAAYRCHRVNCALETVERHCPIAHRHLKRFIVVVATRFAFGHFASPCLKLPNSNLLFASPQFLLHDLMGRQT